MRRFETHQDARTARTTRWPLAPLPEQQQGLGKSRSGQATFSPGGEAKRSEGEPRLAPRRKPPTSPEKTSLYPSPSRPFTFQDNSRPHSTAKLIASFADAFDDPAVRSRKMIGHSATRRPR